MISTTMWKTELTSQGGPFLMTVSSGVAAAGGCRDEGDWARGCLAVCCGAGEADLTLVGSVGFAGDSVGEPGSPAIGGLSGADDFDADDGGAETGFGAAMSGGGGAAAAGISAADESPGRLMS